MSTPSELAQQTFYTVVDSTREDRSRVRKLVNSGHWRDAEMDRTRFRDFNARREDKLIPKRGGAEAITGSTEDLQGSCFLTEGAAIRRAVAYVEVNDVRSTELGSGFLVSPRLFLTNSHVIRDASAARSAQIIFDREVDEFGRPRVSTTYLLDPDTFALFSPEDQLDYALVAVGQRNSGNAGLADLGHCVLSDTPDRHVLGMSVNIIQHPRGLPKMIAVRNNLLTARTNRTLLYETDTEPGSSGSPVFNDEWDVVALHHWGSPSLEPHDDQGNLLPVNVNEGVRISSLYRDLEARRAGLPRAQQELIDEVLSYAKQAPADAGPRRLGPPRNGTGPENATTVTSQISNLNRNQGAIVSNPTSSNSPNEVRFTIPIEVTIRVGSAAAPVDVRPLTSTTVTRELSRGSEAIRIDQDYSNRGGYVPRFIPGTNLPLPELRASLQNQVAPLRAEEPNAAAGELKYEHFSIKMNKSKRMAIFSATNIDGATYLEVSRTTGLVGDSEGETWYKDPRISASFFLDQSFYSAWSTYFDRGHVTRRTDPSWGTVEDAERANADTYHFTNCSPQHFRFNQTAKYWQGAERFVLENGLIAADSGKRINVYQGPLFNNAIDLWSDDVQIPSSFFKLIVWKGAGGLKSVGLIVDQLPLLSEARVNLGPPHDLPSVNVQQWRVKISEIERKSGLNFGDDIRDADTINTSAQPLVGGEAARPLRSLEDILA